MAEGEKILRRIAGWCAQRYRNRDMGRNGLVALRLVLLCMIALLKHGGREALLLAETAIIPTETCFGLSWVMREYLFLRVLVILVWWRLVEKWLRNDE